MTGEALLVVGVFKVIAGVVTFPAGGRLFIALLLMVALGARVRDLHR